MKGDYPEPPESARKEVPEMLALHERQFKTGELPEITLIALRDAIALCAWYRVAPPKWIADGVEDLCYKQIESDRRPGRLGSYRARLKQHRIHLVRWAAVKHLRENCRERARTWSDAYAEASRELRGSIAQGSSEAIAVSYKNHARSPFIRSFKRDYGADAVARMAGEQFAAKDALLGLFSRPWGKKS